MGALKKIDINHYIETYNLNAFVETGTGMGLSLAHAMQFPQFQQVISIEITTELYEKVKAELGDKCLLINNNSKDGLIEALPHCQNHNVFFWLDAHFPGGADYGLTTFDSEKNPSLRLPLEEELKTVKSIRDTSKDVFIIDDLRLYMDGPFGCGHNLGIRTQLGGDGIQFIHDLFDTSHDVTLDYKDEGYIILTPKKKD